MRVINLKLCCQLLCIVVLAGRLSVAEGRPQWGFDDEEEDSAEKKSEAESGPDESAPVALVPTTTAKTNSTQAAPAALAPVAFVHQPAAPTTNLSRSIVGHDHDHSHAGVLQLHYANYNESCGVGEDERHCNPALDMICSEQTKKCTCNPAKNAVYVKDDDSCLAVSTFARDFSCNYDDQCRAGSMGPYSVCNPNTKRCECLDSLGPGRDIIKINDKCVVAKKIGDNCEEDLECDQSIQGYAQCSLAQEGNLPVLPVNGTKECRCSADYIPDTGKENRNPRLCLPVGKDENSACMIDEQCHAGLGPLSRCFAGTCQCADAVAWKGEATFYTGHCYLKLALGDPCENDTQCKAGLNENAVCDKHESYLQFEKVCKCPQGKDCLKKDDGDGAGSLVISINLVLMAIIATRVIP